MIGILKFAYICTWANLGSSHNHTEIEEHKDELYQAPILQKCLFELDPCRVRGFVNKNTRGRFLLSYVITSSSDN